MQAIINYFPDKPDWEGAIITKLCCENSVPVNERIFALAKAGFTDESIMVRIWSFEVKTGDKVALLWSLKNDDGQILSCCLNKNGDFSLSVNGEEKKDELLCYLISGEDLQGEYWGGVFSLPLSLVCNFLKIDDIKKSDGILMKLSRKGEFESSFEGKFKIVL